MPPVGGQACRWARAWSRALGGALSVTTRRLSGALGANAGPTGGDGRPRHSAVLPTLARLLMFASLVGVKWCCGFNLNFSDY